MEDILEIYEMEYDPKCPVICFDEKPYQLLDNVVEPIPMKPGKVKKQDYHYKRKGTCCILMMIEPLTGKRFIEVRERRTALDYAEFIKKVIMEQYPEAEKVITVQDNLNVHEPASFYKRYEPYEARYMNKKIDMHYTPKKASWLNMVEIEFAAMEKQCLGRRIPTIELLRKEVTAWAKERQEKKITINWTFSKDDARERLKRFYERIKEFP